MALLATQGWCHSVAATQATAGPWGLSQLHTPVAQGMVTLPLPGQLLPQPDSSFREEIPPDVYPKCPDRELCWPRRAQSLPLAGPHRCLQFGVTAHSQLKAKGRSLLASAGADRAFNHQYRQGEVPQCTKLGSCPVLSSAFWGQRWLSCSKY